MLRQPRKSSLKIIVNTGLRSLLLDYHNKSQRKKFPDPLRYVTHATLRKWGEVLHNNPINSKQHAVCGLSLHQGSTESRKTLEQKFIFEIGTLNPHGFNERFSFN